MSGLEVAAVSAGAWALGKMKEKATDVAVDFLKDKFQGSVVTRWSNHRAERFLASFVDEVCKEADVVTESADLNVMLAKVADGDKESSLLFDSYRRVALSASKDLGPMIIGLQTAKIALASRDATEEEEQIFMAAESLNDKDFREFLAWMDSARESDRTGDGYALCVNHGAEFPVLVKGGIDEARGLVEVQPPGENSLNLVAEVGAFALKLCNVGVLSQMTQPRGHPQLPNGTNYYLLVGKACIELAELAHRAAAAASATA
ncbi:hypothetical protein [Paraburkholderia sp. Ac-20347]|uniref:hypothetical protein n=1 Tax=Paraburkholderia sp. Ac-20347 TaxID=2703892 RepID=UPI00197D766B|nr:hypothetical protein [Paraburkholderia sp. Ac-20347]MBN3809597.1 hypothetical protein [Paraburkholderia sp. Ac-20347]